MFTARSIDGDAWITSIDPAWRGREEELREWARAGRVVCPGCGQLLHFRFRQDEVGLVKRRPHFAHRAKSDCPLEHQSAEVMEAKALLYEWLRGKFPGDVVMDWPLEIPGWDRPADVYVKTGKKRPLAYWVFDRGVGERSGFVQRVHQFGEGFACQVVWTGSTMTFHESGELKLTRTQRELMMQGPVRRLLETRDRLTFLDVSTGVLSLYRGLTLTHSPNLHRWRVRRGGPLSSAKVDPISGEILFQEDLDELALEREAKRQRLEEGLRRLEEERQRAQERLASPPTSPGAPPSADRVGRERIAGVEIGSEDTGRGFPREAPVGQNLAGIPLSSWAPLHRPLKCRKCGEMTADWADGTPEKGICTCRTCMRRG